MKAGAGTRPEGSGVGADGGVDAGVGKGGTSATTTSSTTTTTTTTTTSTTSCLEVAVSAGNAEAVAALMAATTTNDGTTTTTAGAAGATTAAAGTTTAAAGATGADLRYNCHDCACGRNRPPWGHMTHLPSPPLSSSPFSAPFSSSTSSTSAAAGGTAAAGAGGSVRPCARLASLGLWLSPEGASETGLGGGVEVRVGAVMTDLMNATRSALTQSQGRVDALIAALDYTPPGEVGGRGEENNSTDPDPTSQRPINNPSCRPISPDLLKTIVPSLISLVRACVGLDQLDTPLCHLVGLGKAHCLRVEEMLLMVPPQQNYQHSHITAANSTTINNSTTSKSNAIIEAARMLMMLPAALGITPINKPSSMPANTPYQPTYQRTVYLLTNHPSTHPHPHSTLSTPLYAARYPRTL